MRPVDNEGMIVPGLSLQPKLWGVIALPVLMSLAACAAGNVEKASTATGGEPSALATAPVDAPTQTGNLSPESLEPSMSDDDIAAAGKSGTSIEPARRPRVFGFLFKETPGEVENAVSVPQPAVAIASAEPEDIPDVAQPAARRGWLFGGRNRTGGVSSSEDTSANAVVDGLPFGQVVTICGVSTRKLGTEVARSQGAGAYRLFDSDPSSTQIRPQFLTGFSDNCARQFNASLALFGSAGVHEATRYNPSNTNPYSETDKAYESVKSRLCGVRAGKQCPEKRVSRLERKAAFVSVYKGFGNSGEWLEMFLHDGAVVAYEARTN